MAGFPKYGSEFRMAGNVAVMLLTADPSAGAGVAAVVGTLGLRTTAGSVAAWQKTTAPDTGWTELGSGGGSGSLDDAYDNGATIAVDAGPVTMNSTANDATSVLEISRTIALGKYDAIGIDLTMGVNTLHAIKVAHGGDGNSLDVTQSGSGDAINIDLATSTSNQAVVIAEDAGVARSNAMVSIVRQAAATGHALAISNAGSGDAINVGTGTISSGDIAIAAGCTVAGAGALDITSVGDLTLDPSGDVRVSGANIYLDSAKSLVMGVSNYMGATGTTVSLVAGAGVFTFNDTTLDLGAEYLTGTRGWMADFSGDSVVGTSGEHAYSDADGSLRIVADKVKLDRSTQLVMNADGNADNYISGIADTTIDIQMQAVRAMRIQNTFVTFKTHPVAGTDNTYDLGSVNADWRSVYVGTSVTGTRGYMIDLSGDSVVGTSGEHIYSSADAALDLWSDGTINQTGGQKWSVTTVAAATYDLLITDRVLHVTYTGTGAVTSLTLPTAQTTAGRIISIKDAGGNASVNSITIDTEGAQTIDGSATFVMSTDYEDITLYSDGSNWFLMAQ